MTITKQRPIFVNPFFDEFFGNTNNQFSHVKANVFETKENFILEIEAAGRKKEDFKINIDNDLLNISYETSKETVDENVKTIRKEFANKSFKRSFKIDNLINKDSIEAKYEAGILSIYLPKTVDAKDQIRAISIK